MGLEDRSGPVHEREREVAGGRRHQCGEQHATGEILAVGNLEREHRTRRRCLEDRGDAGRGAGDHEHVSGAPSREAREASLEERPEPRAQIERPALETHGAAEARGRDRSQHPPRDLAHAQRLVRVVERLQVEVGETRVA